MLIVDEAWILMQYPDSARYLYSLAKRARKYYLGLTIISQDVEDFLSNEQGRAILNNSSLQLLLKQSPAAVEKLGEVFHLTEGEKFLLLESDVGEGLFFAGASHVAIKIVASYTEDQIITTDPRQLLAQQDQEQTQAPQGQAISQDQNYKPATAQTSQTAPLEKEQNTSAPTAPAQIQTNPQPVGETIDDRATSNPSNFITKDNDANPLGNGAPSTVAGGALAQAPKQNGNTPTT